ncbi:MAG: membrane-bound lytic murein transglycosylase B [Alphaproteobacteria bacterium]|jgi:membrane-bound lytic murein transglycosylase B
MKTLLITILLVFAPCVFAGQTFAEFIAQIKIEAEQQGIRPTVVDELFGTKPKANAFIVDRYRPRTTDELYIGRAPCRGFKPQKNADKFLENQCRYLSKKRLTKAKKLMKDPLILAALIKVESEYDVDKEAIVALWSIESYFGLFQGKHNIPHVLATLAWHPKERRNSLFKRELFAALKIYAAGHVTKENFKGSWAGAMGQIQFMPTAFLTFAQDGDGDGKADIWNNEADAFASAACYLKHLGWQKGAKWKDDFKLTQKINKGLFYETGLSKGKVYKRNKKGKVVYNEGKPVIRKHKPFRLPIYAFKARGVPVPKGVNPNNFAYLYLPNGNKAQKSGYFLYENFHAVLSWNLSSYFAFGILSIMDELKEDP